MRSDAERIWDGLTSGAGLAAVIVSALAGVATFLLVHRRRYELARTTAAAAVVAIIAGWGFAQRPEFLPGLTIQEAAAGRSTLVSMLVALGLGALILIPSLGLLFSLLLRGRFDQEPAPRARETGPVRAHPAPRLLPAAGICLVVGVVATFAFDSGWGQVVGVPALLAFVALGSVALVTAMTAATAEEA